MNTEQTKNTWYVAGPLALALLVLTLLFYQQTVLYLVGIWNQIDIGEYAHGYMVLAISIYLIYKLKHRLSTLTPRPEYRALLLVACAGILWLLATLVDIEVLQALSFLILIFTLAWSVLGTQVIRLLAFPILFITFAIPVWFPLSPVLQNLTADAVFGAIRLIDVPAFRQNNDIILPAGTLSIEEACSGLRYLLAALTLGTLYAYINYSNLRARLAVVLIAAGSAVLANIIRVFIVVYLGYATEMQHPLVDDHLTLGWYLFSGFTIILLFFDSWLHKKNRPMQSPTSGQQDNITTGTARQSHPHYFMFAVITGLLISIAPVIVHTASHQINIAKTAAPQLPYTAGAWIQTPPNNDWTPVYHGAISQKQAYRNGMKSIDLYIGYYPAQQQGEELINDLNNIGAINGWRSVYSRPQPKNIDGKQVLEQLLDSGGQNRRLIWYWYNVAGTPTTSKYEAKILQALGLLSGKTWGLISAVSTETDADDIDFTRQVMKDFIHSVETPLKNEIARISGHH